MHGRGLPHPNQPAWWILFSHVALPFPPDDPLYGQQPLGNTDVLFLGQMALQGERGLMKIPSDWLLRLRHNPFYPFLETQVLDWVKRNTGEPAHAGTQQKLQNETIPELELDAR